MRGTVWMCDWMVFIGSVILWIFCKWLSVKMTFEFDFLWSTLFWLEESVLYQLQQIVGWPSLWLWNLREGSWAAQVLRHEPIIKWSQLTAASARHKNQGVSTADTWLLGSNGTIPYFTTHTRVSFPQFRPSFTRLVEENIYCLNNISR